jgi:ATP-dependent Clp protease protease subunit
MKQYFSLVKAQNEATINIYGDITSWAWEELGEVSAYNLSRQLEELQDVSVIHVHISSYGGEVKEGLAIYNALRAHKAKVITYCDSFACSIASVIFMAGDERIMNAASLLMVHNAWTYAEGNAAELRKQADDLEVITSASVEAYKARASISEKEIRKLMDNETWIAPAKAVEYGFATGVVEEKVENANQNARAKLFQMILEAQDEPDKDENPEGEGVEDKEEKPYEGGSGDPEGDPEEDIPEANKEKEANQKMVSRFNAIFK